MDRFQKVELVLILIILFVNMFIIILLNNSGVFSGFFLLGQNDEVLNAPFDFISEDDISVYEDKIIIEIENYTLSRYDSSESMIPVFGESATGVGIKPNSKDDIHVGDIISFRQEDIMIVHRVVEKGIDDKGYFFITKGDNNILGDGKIRFSEIDSVLVALIY